MTAKLWRAWLIPGGILLAVTAAVVQTALLTKVAPSLGFYYFAVFIFGILLAWRFNSSRVLFSLLVLLLAHRAVEFFAGGHSGLSGPGYTAVVAVSILVPLNLLAFSDMRERGLTFAGVAPRAGILFLQSVFVAVLCRPENSRATVHHISAEWRVVVALIFIGSATVFGIRYWKTRKPIEPGFAWSLAAVFLWLNSAPVGKTADAYVATAGLILVASIIETSYVLAYHDELTGIPGRRAFNEVLLTLDQSYAIAIVDIDHFKKFNDTYGHDTGDQVLRLVAKRLSEVGRGGKAFRCGGEEFAIVFRDLGAKDAAEELERLRGAIETSTFRLRGPERRAAERAPEPERRRPASRRSKKVVDIVPPSDDLSVTVSAGVAEPSARYRQAEQVIQAADQALYQAKRNGRNRVEIASLNPPRTTAKSKRISLTRR